jgi:streptogramin lyase
MGLVLLTLVSSVGCAGRLSAVRQPSHLSLAGHLSYRHYEAPPRGDDGAWNGGGLPHSVALDAEGNAWVLGEFHTQLQLVSVLGSVQATEHTWIPHHPDALPFANMHGMPTQRSMLGESVVIDGKGRVWLSQGGGFLAREGTNHSRVVSYNPGSGTFKAYNLPGNRNEAIGVYWDNPRGLVWATESGFFSDFNAIVPPATGHQGTIIAFDPETATYDNNWLWGSSLDGELCTGAKEPTADSCFKRYELPTAGWTPSSPDPPHTGALSPAHLVADSSGFIWFTSFWGSTIGRLDPDTEAVTLYPLEESPSPSPLGAVGVGPWDIEVSPDGQYVVWSEFVDGELARMPISRALDPACRTLRGGRNPCVEEVRVPGADLGNQRVGSIAFDRFGNLWFTPSVPNSIGFVTADWSRVELLEPLEAHPDGDSQYAGIAIDRETGDIWFAEFEPPGVVRLTPVDRDVDPAAW